MPVLSVTESQQVDAAGNLSDVLEILFTVPNRTGTFSIVVPKSGDPVAAAKAEIDALSGTVDALYGL